MVLRARIVQGIPLREDEDAHQMQREVAVFDIAESPAENAENALLERDRWHSKTDHRRPCDVDRFTVRRLRRRHSRSIASNDQNPSVAAHSEVDEIMIQGEW
jgi:hypothetical protein